jgi:hypothetical protein
VPNEEQCRVCICNRFIDSQSLPTIGHGFGDQSEARVFAFPFPSSCAYLGLFKPWFSFPDNSQPLEVFMYAPQFFCTPSGKISYFTYSFCSSPFNSLYSRCGLLQVEIILIIYWAGTTAHDNPMKQVLLFIHVLEIRKVGVEWG